MMPQYSSEHVMRDEDPFKGLVWLTPKQASLYVCSASVRAFYKWRQRHGIVSRNNGSVAKADLDRALRRRKSRRVMQPRSLANLLTGRTANVRGPSYADRLVAIEARMAALEARLETVD